jgi:hypothetical protein
MKSGTTLTYQNESCLVGPCTEIASANNTYTFRRTLNSQLTALLTGFSGEETNWRPFHSPVESFQGMSDEDCEN